ncbi:MAG TPA: hypothetical protein VH438_06175 [Gemmatimonadales bacterium]|jgi:hypothetical protein
MNEDELRKAYQSRGVRASDAVEPTPEELQRLVAGQGDEAERLAIMERALSSRRSAGDLELLRAISHAERLAESRSWWRSPVVVGLAASLLLVVGVLSLRDRARDEQRAAPAEGTPVLLEPAVDARVADSIRFVWQPVPGARGYRVELLTDAGNIVTSIETTDTIARYVPTRPAGGETTYRWVVAALLPEGAEVVSPPRRLTIKTP